MRRLVPILVTVAAVLALGACGGNSHNNPSTRTGNRVDLTTGANGASLSSSKATRAVVKYVRHRWGSRYAVHPACYGVCCRMS
jgi:hypothetical protein